MRIKFFITLFILFTGLGFSQEIKEKAEEIITSAFPGKITFNSEKFNLSPELKSKVEKAARQRFYTNSVFIYKIFRDDEKIAYAFIDNVKGKAMPITFLVILDPDGNIISTGIVKYRESYGGAVQHDGWNKQFKGKDIDSDLKVGEDVSGITGATISVNAVTTGIKRILFLFNEIKNKL